MSAKPISEPSYSPLEHSRRADQLFVKAIAGNAVFAVLVGTLAGQAWPPLAGCAAACVLVAVLLSRRWGGTAVATFALSALLAGLAVLTWRLDPARPALAMNLMLVVSLLPAYRRWGLVLALGVAMAALPLAFADASTRADAGVVGVLLLAQVALLVPRIRRDAGHWSALFDVDFLIRAMGRSGAIRLDLAVLKAETPLGQRLKDAQERMAQTLRQVRRASGATQAAAAALQDSGGQLAERTEHTGTELHHASMTLSQIAVIVKESADAALAARDIARGASVLTHEGGEIVGQVVGQMQAIDRASRRITDIVGVIEAIAFQTHLLALNAAVEAARAGAHGRGFAVVAGEVRTLARRAGEAALEVKGLIENSAQAVARGNELAAAAGRTMDALTGSVARVDEVFHSLSADTNEHAVGIEAIRDTMNELREATHRNLGVADQARQIADDLAGRAAVMAEAIDAFRLGASAQDEDATAATAAGIAAPSAEPARPAPPARRVAPAPAMPAVQTCGVEFF